MPHISNIKKPLPLITHSFVDPGCEKLPVAGRSSAQQLPCHFAPAFSDPQKALPVTAAQSQATNVHIQLRLWIPKQGGAYLICNALAM